ncbi:hypothetical protein FVF58_00230 [Paraburkholderia panacisoli]|uniref:Uncharacterized protein n=1 Tax=Paraburkholderia panacisoli TaxID=2603818 RepID=A0A5B0HKL8_9BURK|nr:hypothetical protein [Paraburkholderia panacisoli]KAA1015826.1 hypothetical protein FVF58_00230 [Paraburkholderia panacisoli]
MDQRATHYDTPYDVLSIGYLLRRALHGKLRHLVIQALERRWAHGGRVGGATDRVTVRSIEPAPA